MELFLPMKTIKQLSDELKISKQKLYRYVKANHINEVHHDAGVIYIDETLETLLKQHFSKNDTFHDTHQNVSNDTVLIRSLEEQIVQLKEQLKEKDRQIERNQELLKNQQVLTLQANQKIELLENKEEEKEVFKKTIFGLYKKIKN